MRNTGKMFKVRDGSLWLSTGRRQYKITPDSDHNGEIFRVFGHDGQQVGKPLTDIADAKKICLDIACHDILDDLSENPLPPPKMLHDDGDTVQHAVSATRARQRVVNSEESERKNDALLP